MMKISWIVSYNDLQSKNMENKFNLSIDQSYDVDYDSSSTFAYISQINNLWL